MSDLITTKKNLVNYQTTVAFLKALGCEEELLHFRTLDDSKSGIKGLTKTFYDKFNDVKEALTFQNQIGAGVYITINVDDESGKAAADNIAAIRAFFADKDDGDFDEFPLTPTIVVQSKNGQHAYWVLKSPSEDLELFTQIQKKIAKFLQSDEIVSDLPRIMRLPGFYHQKDINDPFLVEIVQINENSTYTLEEISEAFNKQKEEQTLKEAYKFLSKGTKKFISGDYEVGKWNNSLFKAAKDFQQHSISKDELINRMNKVAPEGGLDKSDLRTIESAYSKPAKYAPRTNGQDNKLSDIDRTFNLFKGHFSVYLDSKTGGQVFLKYDPKERIYKKVAAEYLQSLLIKHFNKEEIKITPHKADSLVRLWSLSVDHLEDMPKAIVLNDSSERGFARVTVSPFDTDTPYWDYILSKLETNKDAFQAFIWSIFERESKNEQYLWLYGEGRDGKGSILRLINKIIGDESYVGLDADDNHWVASCVGKRVGVFNDLSKSSLPTSSKFKQVTGNDKASISNKWEKTFSAHLDTKLIITSNKSLMVSSKKANLRRCIYVKFRSDEKNLSNFEKTLESEISGILFKCRECYHRLVDDNGIIKCDTEIIKDYASDFEIEFETIFEQYFEVIEGEKLARKDVYSRCKQEGMNNFKFSEMKSWILRSQKTDSGEPIEEVRIREGNKQRWYFTNLRLRR